MKILVTGGAGMLARAMKRLMPEAVYVDRGELDVTSPDSVEAGLERHKPELVYNLAAYTKVDQAETDEASALAVNGLGPGILGRAASRRGAHVVHVSTDYVFNGRSDRPWRETDPVGPIGAYGRTKLRGEQELARECPGSLIVRTSWLYGAGGPNFVDTMLRLARERDEIRVVDDQIGCPTWTNDLARSLLELGAGRFRGLCQWSNSTSVSWHGFARHILGRAGYKGKLVPITSAELQRPAPRPAYSVLDTTRASRWLAWPPRPWTEAVDEYLKSLQGT